MAANPVLPTTADGAAPVVGGSLPEPKPIDTTLPVVVDGHWSCAELSSAVELGSEVTDKVSGLVWPGISSSMCTRAAQG